MKHKEPNNIDPDKLNGVTDEGAATGQDRDEATDDKDKLAGDTDAAADKLEPQEEITALTQKVDELNDSLLRVHAEYDNFRKRTLKEKAELIKSGGERVLLDVISLVDDFERALESLERTDDKEALVEGINLIYSKFITFLKQHGVKAIETIDQPFDPDRFEAVTTIPVEEESRKGTVVDCIQKGYEMNEKIIRFPKVIVGE